MGQAVEIKLSAYEYTIYGGLKGTVHSISPGVVGDSDRADGDSTYYRALIRGKGTTPKGSVKLLSMLLGMTGTVAIRTGKRSLLGFVLGPMMKSCKAFREC